MQRREIKGDRLMRPRLLKIWDYLAANSLTGCNPRKPRRTIKLGVEILEDRTVPTTAINASGFVSGLVYVDANANGTHEATEAILRGAMVSLAGTGAQNSSVQLTTTADSSGLYSFRGLLPGPYRLTAGPIAAMLNSAGTVTANINLVAGQALNNQNLGFQDGLGPQHFSLAFLLNTSTSNDLPFEGTAGSAADNAPVVSQALGTISLPQNTTGKIIDLAGYFTDRNYTNSQVRFNLTVNGVAKSMTLNLFDGQAPQTVANFFDYVNAGKFNNTFFNRKTTTATDGLAVLQGGALTVAAAGAGTNFTLVPIGPTVPNEFASSNTLGTIAMALSGTPSNPNSATNQFFINTANNASTLDSQKFTVFGQLDANSLAELASLAATPSKNVGNATLAHNFPPAGFAELPLNNYSAPIANFPANATLSNYLIINSIDVLKRDEFLTYSVVSNSNAGLITPSISNEFLTLNAVAGKTGTATITVRATDRFGASVDQTLTVKITAAPAVTAVAISPTIVTGSVTTLTATPTPPTNIPGNANPVTYTYQWLQNGFPIPSSATPTALTNALSLTPLTVVAGDKFTVQVTPSELVGSTATPGAVFTSDPGVTIATASPNPITLQ
jgi:cyclophilin family peptidyl-prolyl cis-trans isomerase